MTRVLVLGVTGMLGHTVFQHLFRDNRFEVFGTARSASMLAASGDFAKAEIFDGILAENNDTLSRVFKIVRPDFVINCIGLIKQKESTFLYNYSYEN